MMDMMEWKPLKLDDMEEPQPLTLKRIDEAFEYVREGSALVYALNANLITKAEYDEGVSEWWYHGISEQLRQKIMPYYWKEIIGKEVA